MPDMACREPTADEAKVATFIRDRGVNHCPAQPAFGIERFRPDAKSRRDHSGLVRDEIRSEHYNLAQAKLIVMLLNLGGRPSEQDGKKNSKAILRDDAHDWFFGESDFERWCGIAGYDPVYVREKALLIYDGGLPTRLALKGAIKGRRPARNSGGD